MKPTKWSIEYYEAKDIERYLRENTGIINRLEEDGEESFCEFTRYFQFFFDSATFIDGTLFYVGDVKISDALQMIGPDPMASLFRDTISSILDLLGGKERRIVVKV